MPLLGFQQRFAAAVESGEKRQTIRAYRKDGRDPKVGDRLYLYTGLRTKASRKLGESVVVETAKVRICPGVMYQIGPRGGRHRLPEWHAKTIARDDGFGDYVAMSMWFHDTHGLPFEGLLIRWGEIQR